jgi:hypothetical protein
MKRYVLMLIFIGLLSFSVTGCSQAPEDKDAAVDSTSEDAGDAGESGTEKTTEAMEEVKKEAEQMLEDTKEKTKDVVEQIKEGTTVTDVMEMRNTDAFGTHSMGIVMFSHKKHADAAPDGYGIACGECHHDKDGRPLDIGESDDIQGCMACHDKTERPRRTENMSKEDWDAMQLEYYYGAIHANCIDCHRTGGAGPVQCTECHPKPER